jgi:hypothetical protein
VRNRGLQDSQAKGGHNCECRQSVSLYFNK